MTQPVSFALVRKGVDVGSELAVMLEEEAVRRVRVDLDPRVREEPRPTLSVAREDHRVAVAVRDALGLMEGTDELTCADRNTLQDRLARNPLPVPGDVVKRASDTRRDPGWGSRW